MTMLAAENITVTRGGKTILRDVSLQAHAGEFIAVLGPNGAGKSTLLSVLAGLLKPDGGPGDAGRKAAGRAVRQRLAPLRAYLPQNPHAGMAALGGAAGGAGPDAASCRPPAACRKASQPAITRALARCDLADKRDQAATTLSGGEFARAMLARAIVGEPQILIVDEPITGLDPRHAMAVHAASVGYRAQRHAW